MKAIGALPTERRVQEMNNYQWLWFYHNLMEEKKKNNKERDDIIDYLSFFINPDMAKAVQEKKNNNNPMKKNELKSTESYNDEFEKEFGKFFENKDEFIEIPNSGGMQNNENENEFFERAMKIQEFIQNNPNNEYFKELPKAKRIKHKKQQHEMTEKEIIKYSVENNTDVIFVPE